MSSPWSHCDTAVALSSSLGTTAVAPALYWSNSSPITSEMDSLIEPDW